MLRTIIIGTCISIQGTFEAILEGGHIAIRVGDRRYVGRPVTV